jgi:parvulin-like peptidyl-prolyl isomerase
MRRHFTWLLLVPIALLALAASACGGSDASGDVPSDAVAVVGADTITKTEFNQLMDQAKRSYDQRKQKFPAAGSPEYEQLKSQAVNYLVQQSEYEQKASDLDITISDEQVDKRLKELKKQYFGGSEEKYKKQLQQQGLTEEQVRTQLHNQLLQESIFKDITGDVKVSDEDVRKYYNDNQAQYQTGESRDVRHILLSCGNSSATSTSKEKPVDCNTAKAEANKLYDQLQDGADFATLAKKYSDDPGSKAQGGKLTVQRGQTVAAFDQTAFLLGKGTISRPVKTQYGYHIIEPLSAIRDKKTTPYSQVKEAIRQQLLTTKKNEFMADWVKDLKKEFNVSYQVGYKPQAQQTTQPQ